LGSDPRQRRQYRPGRQRRRRRALTAATATIFAPQADTYSTWFDHRKRLGATMSLQYEPGDKLKLGFDALYSQLENSRQDFSLATSGINSLTGNITGTQVMQSAVIQGNTLLASSYTGVDLRSEFNREEDKTKFYQLGLNGAYQITDKLLVKGFVGYSKSDYALPVFDKVFLESKNHAFSFDDRPTMPVNTYDSGMTDPAKWDLMRMDTQENKVSSEYTNAKFDAAFAANDVSTLKGGVEYKKFVNSGAQWTDKEFKNVPANTIISNDLKMTVPFKTLGQYIVGDVDRVYALIGQNAQSGSPRRQVGHPGHQLYGDRRDLGGLPAVRREHANPGQGRPRQRRHPLLLDRPDLGRFAEHRDQPPAGVDQAQVPWLAAGPERGRRRQRRHGRPLQRQPRHQPSGPGRPGRGRLADHRPVRRHDQHG
jgi:hypothetical protein